MTRPTLHLIGGPTASGKTALALKIAQAEGGCVINADAMQVYAGLPLLTAQPDAAEKAQAPHKLFEIFDARERSSAGRWLQLAQTAIDEAAAQGLTPIVVGGTGMYFAALLGGLADIPPIPPEVRTQAIALYETHGHDAFRASLAQLDQISAAQIKPNDRQRLIRAYEVVAHTGITLREWQEKAAAACTLPERFDIKRHVLLPERSALYAACDARFLKMIEGGAIEEVRALKARHLDPDLPAMKILGVPEIISHLCGETTLDNAIAQAQQATRNYAKRQVTWFGNQWKDFIARESTSFR